MIWCDLSSAINVLKQVVGITGRTANRVDRGKAYCSLSGHLGARCNEPRLDARPSKGIVRAERTYSRHHLVPAKHRPQMNAGALIALLLTTMGACMPAIGQPRIDSSEWTIVMFETTGPQDFRVEVNKVGVVHYLGRSNVKRAESVVLRIPKENVERLVDEIEQLRIFDVIPRFSFYSENAAWGLTTTIAVYKNGKTRSLVYQRMANPELHRKIFALLEQYVPTESLRCPFIVPRSPAFATGGDICAVHPGATNMQK